MASVGTGLSKWVTVNKFVEVTGESKRFVDGLISRGIWANGIHYRVTNRRRRVNLERYYEWVEKGE